MIRIAAMSIRCAGKQVWQHTGGSGASAMSEARAGRSRGAGSAGGAARGAPDTHLTAGGDASQHQHLRRAPPGRPLLRFRRSGRDIFGCRHAHRAARARAQRRRGLGGRKLLLQLLVPPLLLPQVGGRGRRVVRLRRHGPNVGVASCP